MEETLKEIPADFRLLPNQAVLIITEDGTKIRTIGDKRLTIFHGSRFSDPKSFPKIDIKAFTLVIVYEGFDDEYEDGFNHLDDLASAAGVDFIELPNRDIPDKLYPCLKTTPAPNPNPAPPPAKKSTPTISLSGYARECILANKDLGVDDFVKMAEEQGYSNPIASMRNTFQQQKSKLGPTKPKTKPAPAKKKVAPKAAKPEPALVLKKEPDLAITPLREKSNGHARPTGGLMRGITALDENYGRTAAAVVELRSSLAAQIETTAQLLNELGMEVIVTVNPKKK